MPRPKAVEPKTNVTLRLSNILLDDIKACAKYGENRTETITRLLENSIQSLKTDTSNQEQEATEENKVETILLTQITFLERQLEEAREDAKSARKEAAEANASVVKALNTITSAQANAIEAQRGMQTEGSDTMTAEIVTYEVQDQAQDPLPDFKKMGVFEAMAAALRLRKS